MHEEWTDEGLYKGLVAREARALEALIGRYSREMSYFIRIVLEGVGTLQDAEECANDLFIAAHARSLGLRLVTNNIAEFNRVKGLTLENWTTLPVRRGRAADDE